MRKISLLAAMIIGAAILTSFSGKKTSAGNNASSVSNEFIDMNIETFNDCTNEMVQLSGQAHMVIVSNSNNNRTSGTFHLNMLGVTGVGESTGTPYRLTGVNNFSFSFPNTNGANTFSAITRINIIGGSSIYKLTAKTHSTINANGATTSFFDDLLITCN